MNKDKLPNDLFQGSTVNVLPELLPNKELKAEVYSVTPRL